MTEHVFSIIVRFTAVRSISGEKIESTGSVNLGQDLISGSLAVVSATYALFRVRHLAV